MIHNLETITETPRYTQYRCRVCCRAFRVLAGTNPTWPEDCGEEQKPVVVPPPSPTPAEWTDARTPPMQIATTPEQQRRLKICNWCEKLDTCLPTPCAKRKAIESGSCPDGKWVDVDYSKAVPDSTDYPLFISEYPGYKRIADKTTACSPAGPRHDTRLYALLSTWHDADIVAAAVKNCFAEGCRRVYILDNDSPDDTVREAVDAGAILARSYTTAFFQDVLRVRLANGIMRAITETEAHPELWWWCSDCDEMLRGPGRETVFDFLSHLPPECNMVGANSWDHYPTDPVANVRGEHPSYFQPMGWLRAWPKTETSAVFCPQGHWKHPLHLFRNGKYTAIWMRGLHDCYTIPEDGQPIEPTTTLLLHHFMFRNEADTRLRHERLCGKDPKLGGSYRSQPDDEAISSEGAMTRYKNLDYIYSGQWDKVRMPHLQAYPELHTAGAPLRHWSDHFKAEDYHPRIS